MKIHDIMTKNVSVVGPEASLREAATMMDDLNVGDLPVCDGERLVGIITDRDIVIRSISAGLDPNSTAVLDSMTSPVLYCFEDEDVEDAIGVMKDKQIRRLPVLSREKRLVGILALGDIATANREKGADVIEKVSEPSEPAA